MLSLRARQDRDSKLRMLGLIFYDMATFCGLVKEARGTLLEAADQATEPEMKEFLTDLAIRLLDAEKVVLEVKEDFKKRFGIPDSHKVS